MATARRGRDATEHRSRAARWGANARLWVIAEWPFTVVIAIFAVALLYLLAEPGHWGRCAGGAAIALLVAAVLRVLVPAGRAGLLAVRSRTNDSVVYFVLGALTLAIDLRLHS